MRGKKERWGSIRAKIIKFQSPIRGKKEDGEWVQICIQYVSVPQTVKG
jgi:hypothetical protein